MKNILTFGRNNKTNRQEWLSKTLKKLPSSLRILDAGAGELQNKKLCEHLNYVSQDYCQYEGQGNNAGLQTGSWDTSKIDIVCDIVNIPEPDSSFDVILCSEVFEHLPDATLAVKEFSRLLKPNGTLIITAPFCSLTHFAPYHFSTGFSRYWYEHHLTTHNFEIIEITPNGNWFEYIAQELWRLPRMGKTYSSSIFGWIAFIFSLPLLFILAILGGKKDKGSSELLTYGWHVIARRKDEVI